jgi:hypothetical protein
MRQQLSVASALAARRERIMAAYKTIGASVVAKSRLAETFDRFDLPLLAPRNIDTTTTTPGTTSRKSDPECATVPWCQFNEDVRTVFDRFIGAAISSIARSDAGADLSALARAQTSPGDARPVVWTRENSRGSGGGLVVMASTLMPDQNETIVSDFPRWGGAGRFGLAGMTVVWAGLGAWLFFITRQLFFATYRAAPPVDALQGTSLVGSHTIILGPPRSGKRRYVERFKDRVTTVDIRLLPPGPAPWAAPADAFGTVALDHFDHDIDRAESNVKKLELIEALMFRDNKTVCLLTTVDPMYYLTSGYPSTMVADDSRLGEAMPLLDRWSSVLSRFDKVIVEDDSAAQFGAFVDGLAGTRYWTHHRAALACARDECNQTPHLRSMGRRLLEQQTARAPLDAQADAGAPLTREAMLDLVADRAGEYYHALWGTCSKLERLALFQLAADGWVNPKNRDAIHQLHRRGLITDGAGFRVMNETFSRFVSASQYPSEVAEWETLERQSTWRALKLSLGIAAVLGGVWLFYAQQEFLDSSLAYIGGSVTAATTLLKLISDMRRGGGAKAGG